MNNEKYDELTITNDFMFSKVMRNEHLCKKLLELILGVKIARIEYSNYQQVIDISVDAKSVRLDVYVEDGNNTVYNVEMQTTANQHLPKRSRYYQGIIDMALIEKGELYNKLKKSFVIFICTFDPFGEGRHIYTFENRCTEDNSILLNDETSKVFINTKGTVQDVDEELRELFDYFNGMESNNEYVQLLANEVKRVKENKEWRREYMTLLLREQEKYEAGKAEGLEQGLEQGILGTIKIGLKYNELENVLEDVAVEYGKTKEEIESIWKHSV